MSRSLGLITALGLGLAVTAPASAQPATCLKRADLVRQLAEQFQEAPVAYGIAENGGAVEVFVNPTGTTWTLTVTMPSGVSCLIATGEHWESIAPVFFGRPA